MDPTAIKTSALRLQNAFAKAASATGVSFDFLLNTAARESGMRQNANAKGSSAAGLFQFVEQTWLAMVARHGNHYGLGKEAAQISRNEHGQYEVADSAVRNRVLELRYDPEIATAMAAELGAENKAQLSSGLGRSPTNAEMYAAHFLGAGKALQLIRAAAAHPDRIAATDFSKEARANPGVFRDESGNPRTMSGLMEELGRMHESNPEAPNSPQVLAEKQVFSHTTEYAHAPISPFGGVASASLQLSPFVVQLLAELSAPGAAKEER